MKVIEFFRSIWFGDKPAAKNIRRLIKIILLIVLFAALLWIIPVRSVIEALANAQSIYLASGLILAFPVVYLGAVQLKFLILKHEINLSVIQILVINLTIIFYLLFLPGAIVGGGMRWYKFSQAGGKVAESLVAVLFNRLLETFLVIVLGFGFFLLSGEGLFHQKGIGLLFLLGGTAFLWFILTRSSASVYRWFQGHPIEVESTFWRHTLDRIEKFLSSVSTYADVSTWELLAVIFVGILRLFLNILSFQLLALSVGITLPIIDMGWINSVVTLTALLPFSVAGGLGYREVSLVAILGAYGVPGELALALSILLLARNVMLGLIGGVIEAVQTFQTRRS